MMHMLGIEWKEMERLLKVWNTRFTNDEILLFLTSKKNEILLISCKFRCIYEVRVTIDDWVLFC